MMMEPKCWIDFLCNKFDNSDQAREMFCDGRGNLLPFNHEYYPFQARSSEFADLFAFYDTNLALEITLGLSIGYKKTRGLAYCFRQEIRNLYYFDVYTDSPDGIYINSEQSKCTIIAISPKVKNQTLLYHFLADEIPCVLGDLLGANPKDVPQSLEPAAALTDKNFAVTFSRGLLLIPEEIAPGLEPGFENEEFYFRDPTTNKTYRFAFGRGGAYYSQPNAKSVEQYIKLRKSVVMYENANPVRFPQEEYVKNYLTWLHQIMLGIESDNIDTLELVDISHDLVSNLAKDYPLIPKIVDFYKKKLQREITRIEKVRSNRLGYHYIPPCKPLLDILKKAIIRLQKTRLCYCHDLCGFFDEETINSNLSDKIHCENASTSIELEKIINSSKIDILMSLGNHNLAIEAKIAYQKNGSLNKEGIDKALFTQAPNYEQNMTYDGCAVFYVFDKPLTKFWSNLTDHINTKPKCSISPSKPGKYDHLILKHKVDNVETSLDILVVSLYRESNTKRHR